VLGDATCVADLGTDFGAGFTAAELDYLVREEWVCSAADALWRRSKLGLHLSEEGRRAVDERFRQSVPRPETANA
jgi:glycerol-3-phosphate dehydrogenase